MSEGDQLGVADFPLTTTQAPSTSANAGEPLIVEPAFHAMAPTMVPGLDPAPMLTAAGNLNMLSPDNDVRPLEELESEIIRFAITHYRGQMSEVARRLKIGRSTLYRKLDEAAEKDSSIAESTPSN
jgi:DNA-binding NtrC family response regulator